MIGLIVACSADRGPGGAPDTTLGAPSSPVVSVHAGPYAHAASFEVEASSEGLVVVTCEAEAPPDQDVPERVSASGWGPAVRLDVTGLLADTAYGCTVQTADGDRSVSWATGPLDPALQAGLQVVEHDGSTTSYVLFNLAARDLDVSPAVGVLVDRGGRPRWVYVGADADQGLAVEPSVAQSVGSPLVWIGGGNQASFTPRGVDASGEAIAAIDPCDGCNHDLEPAEDVVHVIRGGGVDGFCVDAVSGDGQVPESWCLADHPDAVGSIDHRANSLTVSADGLRVVSLASDVGVLAWDAATGAPAWSIGGPAPTLAGPADDVLSGKLHDVNRFGPGARVAAEASCDHEICLLAFANRTRELGSAVVSIGVDPSLGTWTVSRSWPVGAFAPVWGGAWPLEDGGWLVAIGQSDLGAADPSAIVDLAPDGLEVRWRAELPAGAALYRARTVDPCAFLSHRGFCPP